MKHDLTCIDQLLDHRLAAHRFHQALVEGPRRALSVIGGLRPTFGSSEDHLLVKRLEKRAEVTSVVRIGTPTHVLSSDSGYLRRSRSAAPTSSSTSVGRVR